jgi:hypothetical protein
LAGDPEDAKLIEDLLTIASRKLVALLRVESDIRRSDRDPQCLMKFLL